jgi:hypothetical protein
MQVREAGIGIMRHQHLIGQIGHYFTWPGGHSKGYPATICQPGLTTDFSRRAESATRPLFPLSEILEICRRQHAMGYFTHASVSIIREQISPRLIQRYRNRSRAADSSKTPASQVFLTPVIRRAATRASSGFAQAGRI